MRKLARLSTDHKLKGNVLLVYSTLAPFPRPRLCIGESCPVAGTRSTFTAIAFDDMLKS